VQDAVCAAPDDGQGLFSRIARCHPVGKSLRGACWNRFSGRERQGHCRGVASDDSNDLGPEAEKIAGRYDATDAGAHADRDIDRVEVGDGAKQFERVAGDALDLVWIERRDEMQVLLARDPMAFGERLVEISAELDHGRAECAHGGILIHRVAARHVDRRANSRPGGRKGDGLAMIAARGRDNPRHFCPRALQTVHVDDAATHLEGASRRVVLVLHPHFAPGPLGKKRPGILRRRRHRSMHKFGRSFQFCKGEQRAGRAHQNLRARRERKNSAAAGAALSCIGSDSRIGISTSTPPSSRSLSCATFPNSRRQAGTTLADFRGRRIPKSLVPSLNLLLERRAVRSGGAPRR
jgi:hypothetical protein